MVRLIRYRTPRFRVRTLPLRSNRYRRLTSSYRRASYRRPFARGLSYRSTTGYRRTGRGPWRRV